MRQLLGPALLALICWLAWWQFDWMGAEPATTISHGVNEDWDWQLSFYEASRRSIAEYGQLPGWNPYTQGGVPLLANPESPFLYPPFLFILLLGSSAGLKVWVLFHLMALAAACWLAGRAMGLGPATAHGAGLLALCSASIPAITAMGHIMYLPLCWLPLAWLALRRGRWRLLALCLAMTVLAGGHHLAMYALIWLGADLAFRSLAPGRAQLLGYWLLLNLLLLGHGWAAWPLALGGLAALALQRPQAGGAALAGLTRLLAAGVLAALICAPKLATLPTLWERAERLAPQRVFSIADPYSPWRALQVLQGLVERPSAHNGQNVLFGALPLVLALIGVFWALRRRPAVALTGLLFLNLGWGGATPVNLLQLLHRLPPFDHIRVVERYSLVWTLFLGWFAAWGVVALWRMPWLRWLARPAVLLAMGWHLWGAAPEAAWRYHIGPGRPHVIPAPGEFQQSDDELTNWEAMRAERGKPRCWTTAWLEDPGPVLARQDAGYQGEVHMADGTPVQARITPNRIHFEAPFAGELVVNQNAFAGWQLDGRPAGSRQGLLAAQVAAGPGSLVYRPPGLGLGLALLALGGVLLVWPVTRLRRALR